MAWTTPFLRVLARAAAVGVVALVGTAFDVVTEAPPASATVTVTSHFIWTATSSNTIDGFITEINNAATNGDPNAILLVTPVFNAGGVCGCVNMTEPIAVYYVPGDQKWGIIDAAISTGDVPVGAGFNVLVVQNPSNMVFTATATSKNISGNGFTLNESSTVGQGGALLQVTQNYTPDGHQVPDVNAHMPGVVYGLGKKGNRWAIQNVDNGTMPVGASYNVMVGNAASNGGKAKLLTGDTSDTSGTSTFISDKQTNGNPNAVVFATQTFDPNLNFGTNDPHPYGVGYANSPSDVEYVLNEDGSAMPTTTYYFNLLIFSS